MGIETAVAVATIGAQVGGIAANVQASRDAKKSRVAQQRIALAQMREDRQQRVREMVLKQAQLGNIAAQTGTAGSSGAAGAAGSMMGQTGSALGFSQGTATLSAQGNSLENSAMRYQTMGQNLFAAGDIFSTGAGWMKDRAADAAAKSALDSALNPRVDAPMTAPTVTYQVR